MSKNITLQNIDDIVESFRKALSGGKFTDGKITFTQEIPTIQRRATLRFTEKAWIKMQALVDTYTGEVGWHGIAKRGDDPDKDEYVISDILVYPQVVTGATVDTDQEKYQMWLMMQEDDIFNNIRMHGHSHVNMATTPSSVDLAMYDGIIEQLEDDMFYIFMIWNKRREKHIKIYDMLKNILFETSDVDVVIEKDNGGLLDFLKSAETSVEKKTYTYGYSPYSNGYSQLSNSKKPDDKKLQSTSCGKDKSKESDKKGSHSTGKPEKTDKKSDSKKNKKKGKPVSNNKYGRSSYYSYDDDYGYQYGKNPFN